MGVLCIRMLFLRGTSKIKPSKRCHRTDTRVHVFCGSKAGSWLGTGSSFNLAGGLNQG